MTKKLMMYLLLVGSLMVSDNLMAQEVVMPVRVEGPRVSRTTFTNLELIEVSYTVGYMDGYELIWDELRPYAMNFGVLEVDSGYGDEVIKINERKFRDENYIDLFYHLRYINEKKDTLIIPKQRFAYRSTAANSNEVKYVETEPFLLNYVTVLTKDAVDIKDYFDFGSYATRALILKIVAVGIVLVGGIASIWLLVFKPSPVGLIKDQVAESTEDKNKVISPSFLIHQIRENIASKKYGLVHNGLMDLVRIYVPEIKAGADKKQIVKYLEDIPYKRERDALLVIYNNALVLEGQLYLHSDQIDLRPYYSGLDAALSELNPVGVYWRRRLFNIKKKVREMTRFRRKS